MATQETYNQDVNVEEGFVDGDGYPSCEGSPCDNMAEESQDEAGESVNMAEESDAAREVAEWKDKFLRLQAEFDNYRRRTLKEKMDLVQSGGADTIKAFLPVVDDVHRAVEAMGKSDDIEALRSGVSLIANKFSETLKQRGVVEIEAMDMELDTDHHEAVARFAAGEDKKGRIIDVVQRGYMLGDKVLRFAKVVVGE